jgi:hypothetical protein
VNAKDAAAFIEAANVERLARLVDDRFCGACFWLGVFAIVQRALDPNDPDYDSFIAYCKEHVAYSEQHGWPRGAAPKAVVQ